MKLSVVIPAYNEEKYIHTPLQSLSEQDYQNFEIIVCLNNCTDRTEKIVKSYINRGKLNIKIVKENHKGVAYARDAGFRNSSSEIIASADADTFYPPEWAGLIIKNFSKNKWDCIYGPVYIKSDSRFLKLAARYFFTIFLKISNLWGNYNLNGMNFAIRSKAFTEIGGFNKAWKSAEDVYIGIKLKEMKYRVGFINDLKVYTHDRRFKRGKFLELKHHIKNYINIFIKKNNPEDFKDIR